MHTSQCIAHSDQIFCILISGKYMLTFYMQILKILAHYCRWADWIQPKLVSNPKAMWATQESNLPTTELHDSFWATYPIKLHKAIHKKYLVCQFHLGGFRNGKVRCLFLFGCCLIHNGNEHVDMAKFCQKKIKKIHFSTPKCKKHQNEDFLFTFQVCETGRHEKKRK